jgi:hypothetical protein
MMVSTGATVRDASERCPRCVGILSAIDRNAVRDRSESLSAIIGIRMEQSVHHDSAPSRISCCACAGTAFWSRCRSLQTVSIVDEAIEDGICHRWVCNRLVPVLDRQLAGDERGAAVVPVIDKLQEIVALIGSKRREAPIVEDQQIDTRERAQQA